MNLPTLKRGSTALKTNGIFVRSLIQRREPTCTLNLKWSTVVKPLIWIIFPPSLLFCPYPKSKDHWRNDIIHTFGPNDEPTTTCDVDKDPLGWFPRSNHHHGWKIVMYPTACGHQPRLRPTLLPHHAQYMGYSPLSLCRR